MRKLLVALCLSVMLMTTVAGCGSWWSNFKKDPVAQVQSVISTLDTVITISTAIFSEAKMLLPEAKRAKVQDKFTHGVLAVEAAKRALRDGLEAARAAQEDSPNLITLMDSAVKAANDLRALVREIQQMVKMDAPAGSAAAPPAEPDDLDAAVEALSRYR